MKNYVVTTARQLLDIHGQEIIQFEKAYAEYLEQFDLQVVILPILSDIQAIYNLRPQMILLPGGGDVPVEYYDSEVKVFSQSRRDSIEIQLINFAIDNSIPLLGICRGMQMINGFFGGKITRRGEQDNSVAINHDIYISDCNNFLEVNSFHRDIIKKNGLANQLVPIAFHRQYQHVEAFVGIKYPILGLQWHPERMSRNSSCQNYSNKLIRELITRRGVS